jgi:hypothetical protein
MKDLPVCVYQNEGEVDQIKRVLAEITRRATVVGVPRA